MSIHSHKRAIANRTASPINHRTANAIGTCFLPREQLFPKSLVLLGSNARSLSVSDAQEQVRALARRRLQELTINS